MNDPILTNIEVAVAAINLEKSDALTRLQSAREARQQLLHPLHGFLQVHRRLLSSIANAERNLAVCVTRDAELKAMCDEIIQRSDDQASEMWRLFELYPSRLYAARSIEYINSWLEKSRAQIPLAVADIISYAEKHGLTELLPADILANQAK